MKFAQRVSENCFSFISWSIGSVFMCSVCEWAMSIASAGIQMFYSVWLHTEKNKPSISFWSKLIVSMNICLQFLQCPLFSSIKSIFPKLCSSHSIAISFIRSSSSSVWFSFFPISVCMKTLQMFVPNVHFEPVFRKNRNKTQLFCVRARVQCASTNTLTDERWIVHINVLVHSQNHVLDFQHVHTHTHSHTQHP